MLPGIAALSRDLGQGRTTSRALTEACLERIAGGEGPRTFTSVFAETARVAADAADRLRAAGVVLSPVAGVPFAVKDLFDVAGETTLAGSTVLRGSPAAAADAAIVNRLRRAGAVLLGKTNMTEFAFSGLGINPHYGTPRCPWDRAVGRVPGGSSSGAGVSVADAMAPFSIGTDTAGSVRVPAAFNGVVGFKPTARRVPRGGCYPLSPTLDSIGPLAPDVASCALVDAVLAGEDMTVAEALPIAGLRLGVPRTFVLEGLDAEVARAFERSLARLSAAGARVVDVPFPELAEVAVIQRLGGFSVPEAYAQHRALIAAREAEYDPRVASRILRGRGLEAADYLEVVERRAAFIRASAGRIEGVDALVFPTAAIVPPPIAVLEASDEAYFRANARALRNTNVVNLLDGCALSIPCHEPGEAPVGLMVAGAALSDRKVLAAGLAIERALQP